MSKNKEMTMKQLVTTSTTLAELQVRLSAFSLSLIVDVRPGGFAATVFDLDLGHGHGIGATVADAINAALNGYVESKGDALFAPVQS